MRRVFLINAGNDKPSHNVANYSVFPPLNVLSIASAVQQEFKNIAVHIYDGQLDPVKTINNWIRSLVREGDVVGISVLSSSYRNAIKHAKAAKRAKAITILGNDHAAVYCDNILHGHDSRYVDYICTADIGERVFCSFLRSLEQGRKMTDIPKLMYAGRERRGRMKDKEEELPNTGQFILDQIPLVNWELIRDKRWSYSTHYQVPYKQLRENGAKPIIVTINRARGCHRHRNPCLYCGIVNLRPRFSSPLRFWDEVRHAKNTVNANIFYEACDSLSSHLWWVEKVVNEKPADLDDAKFFVYSEAIHVNDELVDLYKRLGVILVNMGLDSGDDEMLRKLKGRSDSVSQNKKAVELLNGNDISVYASFVLGAPGETSTSLNRTAEFAESLIEKKQLAAIEVQPLYPLFNARAGKWLRNPEEAKKGANELGYEIKNCEKLEKMARKWSKNVDPAPDKISKDWVDIFCDVGFSELQKTVSRIKKCAHDNHVPWGQAW